MTTPVGYDLTTMQSTLFAPSIATNGFRDPSFTKNRSLPLHRWVPWVAGFSADFVQDCIRNYLSNPAEGSCVLDPFAGVGTTLVESYLRGLNVIGFEINPYAALATNLKLQAVQIRVGKLTEQIASFERYMERIEKGSTNKQPRSQPPTGFRGRTQLFSPKVERKVLLVLDFIYGLEDRTLRKIFLLALGSVMIGFSNYSYEPSLTRRSAVGKPAIEDANVGSSLSAKLHVMLQDIVVIQRHMKSLSRRPTARVFPTTIFEAPEILDENCKVDLVVTSPPYLNNYHYPRNTRPQLHWLGFTSGTGYNGAREQQSFGKFWQTVREAEPVASSFVLPDLLEKIETIRNRNSEKGCYGGPGWANYVATYFNDTHDFCKLLVKLLKPGAVAVIVLGNSIIQGIEVRTDDFFGRIGELAGLKFENNHLLRKKRTGSSIIQSSVRVDHATQKTVLYESAIALRKP